MTTEYSRNKKTIITILLALVGVARQGQAKGIRFCGDTVLTEEKAETSDYFSIMSLGRYFTNKMRQTNEQEIYSLL